MEDHTPGNQPQKTDTSRVQPAIQATIANIVLVYNTKALQSLVTQIHLPEARAFLDHQAMLRNVHLETYTTILRGTAPSKSQFKKLIQRVEKTASYQRQKTWLELNCCHPTSLRIRVVAVICTESILMTSLTAMFSLLGQDGPPDHVRDVLDNMQTDRQLTVKFLSQFFVHYTSEDAPAAPLDLLMEAVELELSKARGHNAATLHSYTLTSS
ncbi:hypothetical protein B0H11DRAFT_1910217 [Mycena galericulata]|nr:hypothetical protein B0H11DRAFT_1910217 [Mycena galericulata]